ncbi:hypothetical protein BPAE_0024g00370 [Botrytis paeoniae]|uniref:RING-type domain-containing protein n=1 Tax=Botrytis paeoniae TaxID=278948 RepID=A0A4Z1G057_9HELO|nr:hypothetical protein BPAE_0024g00370 [Botrytis paeoniae]
MLITLEHNFKLLSIYLTKIPSSHSYTLKIIFAALLFSINFIENLFFQTPHRTMPSKNKKNKKKSVKSDITTTLSTEMANLSISPNIHPTPESTKQVVKSESVVDDCPICCDEMNELENNIRMEHCCKRSFHGACLRLWANEQTSINREGTCPMCRGEWPVEFVEQLFEGYEEEELIEVPYKCSCNEDSYMGLLAPNILQGLSEEQKSSLRELIAMIEWEYQHTEGYANPTQCLLIVFMMCPEDPLQIDLGESSADRQYEVMKILLMWALDHLEEYESPLSHSTFAFFPRPSNYDHFGPEPYLAELSEL